MAILPVDSNNHLDAGIWRKNRSIDLFPPIACSTVVFFFCIGIFLQLSIPPRHSVVERAEAMHHTHFILEEQPKPVSKVVKKPEPEKPALPEEEVIDLSDRPIPAQDKNEHEELPSHPVKKKVRKVYGIKKVYSKGIGVSGSAGEAIIGKHGNTLNTAIDTITATEGDLSGTPVSVTTVTTFPKLINTVKPEYTKEMLENSVEGVVRVKVTIDIDGRVKKVVVLDDLGYGSKEKVAEACFKLLFEPARVGDDPVATTIQIKIRFTMIGK